MDNFCTQSGEDNWWVHRVRKLELRPYNGESKWPWCTRISESNKLKEFWLKGPSWLSDESARPEQPAILEMDEAKVERRKKEMLLLAEDKAHGAVKYWAEGLLKKFPYWKILRITAYVNWFIDVWKKSIRAGPITKSEIGEAEKKMNSIQRRNM